MIAPRIASLVIALVLVAPIALVAQQEPVVAPGARVRVTAPSISRDRVVGTIVEMGVDTCVLEVEGHAAPITLPLASVTNLEVSRGRMSNVVSGAGFGLLIGAVAGAMFGFTNCGGGGCIISAEEAGAWSGAIGGGAGLLIGAAIGASSERWEVVDLQPVRVGLTAHGADGLAVSVSVAF